jgi:pimeloyl-ACP methyl ester carboxylesterase
MRGAGSTLALVLGLTTSAFAEPRWTTLPPTPTLPKATRSGHVPVDHVKIWWAEFGSGDAVILLHGAFGNSNYWGNQVPALAKRHRVVVMDSRGHGRSTRDEQPFSYELMASDVVAVMQHLRIEKAAIVGLSDGAIIGLELAIHHPKRVTGLFAFGANSDPSGLKEEGLQSPTFTAYMARVEKEYAELSGTPTAFKAFVDDMSKMFATQPNFTKEQLNGIRVPTWIVDGDHDELIRRENTESMAAAIPRAGLLLQPEVGHFAPLQDPELFNDDVLHFLAHAGSAR